MNLNTLHMMHDPGFDFAMRNKIETISIETKLDMGCGLENISQLIF